MANGIILSRLLGVCGGLLVLTTMSSAQADTIQSSNSGQKSESTPAQPQSSRSPAVIQATKQLEQIRNQYNDAVKSNGNRAVPSQTVERLKFEMNRAELRLRQAELAEENIPETHKLILNRDLDTALAETKVRFATSVYDTAQKLYSRGANSKQQVKRALYELNISQIELRRAKIIASDLAEDEIKSRLALLQIDWAKLDYDQAFANYELMKRLYQKSSVSKLRLLYSHYQVKIARLDLAAAQVEASRKSDLKKRFELIDLVLEKARAKNKFLNTVHESNRALFEKGRISKRELMRSRQALDKSELELEAAKAAAASHIET